MRRLIPLLLLTACIHSAPVQVAIMMPKVNTVEYVVNKRTYDILDSMATSSAVEHVEKMTCLDSFALKQHGDTLDVVLNTFYTPRYLSDAQTIYVDTTNHKWLTLPCIHTHVDDNGFLSHPSDIDLQTAYILKTIPFDVLMSVYGPHQWELHTYAFRR